MNLYAFLISLILCTSPVIMSEAKQTTQGAVHSRSPTVTHPSGIMVPERSVLLANSNEFSGIVAFFFCPEKPLSIRRSIPVTERALGAEAAVGQVREGTACWVLCRVSEAESVLTVCPITSGGAWRVGTGWTHEGVGHSSLVHSRHFLLLPLPWCSKALYSSSLSQRAVFQGYARTLKKKNGSNHDVKPLSAFSLPEEAWGWAQVAMVFLHCPVLH